VKWTKLSCRRFKDTAARLQCSPWRTTWPTSFGSWCLPKPISELDADDDAGEAGQDKGAKGGALQVVIFQLAEVAVRGSCSRRILERIARLSLACASG